MFTKEEAIQLAQNGIKMHHRFFGDNEYITATGLMIRLSGEHNVTAEEFWADRQDEGFDKDWVIYQEGQFRSDEEVHFVGFLNLPSKIVLQLNKNRGLTLEKFITDFVDINTGTYPFKHGANSPAEHVVLPNYFTITGGLDAKGRQIITPVYIPDPE